MHQPGKLLVISFFVVGLILASGAIWYHYAKTRWAMAFWGQETARLIVRASEVELFRVTALDNANPPTGEPEISPLRWELEGQPLQILQQENITKTPGLIHMRMALVEDANFDPGASIPAARSWDYVFQFSEAGQQVLIAVDSQQGLVRLLNPKSETPTPIASIRPIASGMQKFLKAQFPNIETEPDSPTAIESIAK